MTCPTLARQTRRTVLALLLAGAASLAGATPAAAPAASATPTLAPLPANSIYQLTVPLTDQSGRSFRLDEHRGQPMLISMFYTSCQFVCPMLIDALRDTEARLTEAERARLHVLIVSFDPAHDSVAVLKRTADQRHLDGAHWSLARTDARNVRKLAAMLGIQYRALPDGEFNHTTALILIDANGRIAGRTAKLGDADPAFVKLVKAAVQAGPN
ncbi:MAG TPA: SCO family protein [Burkholderiaceae bacterium]